jgi:hypothetical protein
MGNNQRVEQVRYNSRNRPNRHDSKNARGSVLARNYIFPEGDAFPVFFDSTTTATSIGVELLDNNYIHAEITYGPHNHPVSKTRRAVMGTANITIYIEGTLESQRGWQFQFDLRVQIIDGPDRDREQGLTVGSKDMACFDSALRTRESELVLRPNNNRSNTGIMQLR